MSTAALATRVTAAEYLAMERASEEKHELRDGEIVDMAGATFPHNKIAMNAVISLGIQFQNRPCHVLGGDMRVKVAAGEFYTYPDLVAWCGEPVLEDDEVDTLLNPGLLMEVLSPSSEAYDRGEKFEYYRQIPSLTDYLLAAQDRVHVEQFTRQPDGTWRLREYKSLDDTVRVESLDAELPLRGMYDKVFARS